MAKEASVKETSVKETPVEETTSTEPSKEPLKEGGEETSEKDVKPVPESDSAAGKDVSEAMDELLKDEADDLDIPEEEVTPPKEAAPSAPKGQEPPAKEPEPAKPVEAPPEVAKSPPAELKPGEQAPTPTPVVTEPGQTPPAAPEAATVTPEPAPTATLTPEEMQAQYQESRTTLEKQVGRRIRRAQPDGDIDLAVPVVVGRGHAVRTSLGTR